MEKTDKKTEKVKYGTISLPLPLIEKESGAYIARGIHVSAIDRDKKWDFKPVVNSGDTVAEGDVLGQVQETALITHKSWCQRMFSVK